MSTLTTTTANPQTIDITLNSSGLATGTISGTTHSDYSQKVVLKLIGGQAGAEEQTITFEGKGENVAMKTVAKNPETIYNMINWMLPITGTATFYYDDGSGYVAYPASKVSMASDSGEGSISITSEDSNDGDFNDIVLVISTKQ